MGTPGAPRPFTGHIPDGILADLRERLVRTRWPDEVPAAGWRYGTYRGAGIAASSDPFVLTLLGAGDVAVYGGSFEEWARDPACPMESGPVGA